MEAQWPFLKSVNLSNIQNNKDYAYINSEGAYYIAKANWKMVTKIYLSIFCCIR